MVLQPINGEALQPTTSHASSETIWVQTRIISQGPKGWKLPELPENRHMKVATLSNLHGNLDLPDSTNIPMSYTVYGMMFLMMDWW